MIKQGRCIKLSDMFELRSACNIELQIALISNIYCLRTGVIFEDELCL